MKIELGGKKNCGILLFLILAVYPLVSLPVFAQFSSQVVVSSNGVILTPTPSPTPAPTPTPTPMPNLVNLAPFPSRWWIDRAGQVIDNSVTYNGQPTLRLDRPPSGSNNPDRECNSYTISVKPGDRIVFSVCMRTSASGLGDTNPYSGARIGIDFYAAQRITALHSDGQHGFYPNENSQAIADNYVRWGTSTWTVRTIDFVIPQSMMADGLFGYPQGTMVTPTSIILWVQVWSSSYGANDPGQAWFANFEAYKNP